MLRRILGRFCRFVLVLLVWVLAWDVATTLTAPVNEPDEETQAAVRAVLERARRSGAPAGISYSEASAYLHQHEAARLARLLACDTWSSRSCAVMPRRDEPASIAGTQRKRR